MESKKDARRAGILFCFLASDFDVHGRGPWRAQKAMNARGFTLIELLIVVGVIGLLSAIAVPGLVRARIAANEASAVSSVRSVLAAQQSYASAASGGYAVRLATLGIACPGGTVPFISTDLVSDPSAKGGYRITLAAATGAAAGPLDCNGTATRGGFYVTATPLSLGLDGHRGFASNASGTIFFDASGAAPAEAQMGPGGAPVVQ